MAEMKWSENMVIGFSGRIQYRRLSWNGTNSQWVDSSWPVLPDPQPTYLDYFDLDGAAITAPQLGVPGIDLQRKKIALTGARAGELDLELSGGRVRSVKAIRG